MRFTGEQKKNEKIHTQSLPPNIEELFTRFALGSMYFDKNRVYNFFITIWKDTRLHRFLKLHLLV